MSRARDLANLGGSADAGGLTGRNLIINGAMTVAQRGDVTGITNPGIYGGADRFGTNGSSFGTVSLVQEADAPEGFAYSQRVKFTTARSTTNTSDHFVLGTRLEGQNLQHLNKGTSNAKSLTVSFYAKASQSTTIQLELYDADNSRHAGKEFAITTSWAEYSYTFDGDTTGAFDNDNALSLYVFFWLGAGTDFTSGTNPDGSWIANTNTRRVHSSVGTTFMDTLNAEFNLTGVQLEVGEQATPFEHEDYGTTLAKCQRYYYKIAVDTSADSFCTGHNDATTAANGTVSFPVTMRDSPTAIETSGTTGDYVIRSKGTTRGLSSVPTFIRATNHNSYFQFSGASGLTQGDACTLRSGSADAYLAWSSEL
jgi:hypothetical protein